MAVPWDAIRREPFRLLFPLGAVFGLLGVTHWLAYALGWLPTYSGFYHASIQVGSYLMCFIVGFLLTALPRFANTAPASSAELATILAWLLAQPIFLSLGQWVAAEVSFAGLLVSLALFAARRFAKRRSGTGPPTEFVWILIAILHGLLGTALLVLGQLAVGPSWALAAGRPMVQQGFLLGIVLGVGGFMGPRLMGRGMFQPTPALEPAQARRLRRRRMTLHLVAGLVLFGSFWLEGLGAVGPAYLMRAAVVTAEVMWTVQLHRPPAIPDRYVTFLWLSFWMLVVGLWGAGLWPRYRIMWLHLVFIGGFSLMTFAVGTMVVLSHAGEGRRLRAPLPVLRLVGIGVAGALIARGIANLWPAHFFFWLGAAAAAWAMAGVGWLVFILPRVLRPLEPGTFEQLHEEAKRQLLTTSPIQTR